MTLNEWFLLAWGLLCVAGGFRNVLAPEKAIRSRNRWDGRYARWMTFGLLRKGPRPIMSHERDLRLTFWGGVVITLLGLIALAYLVVTWVK